MTADELHAFLIRTGWHSETLAQVLARDHRTVRRWRKGTLAIPDDEARWIVALDDWLARHPPPMRKLFTLSVFTGA